MGLGLAAHSALNVPNPTRVVVLITDGRSNAGSLQPLSAAQAANRLGVRIHTIGVGPEVGEDPLNQELLEGLAEAGGGRFHEAADAGGLREVLASLDELETGPVADEAGFQVESRHRGLLLLALSLLVLEAFLHASPRGRLS
jgi:Ca-activated chloride channel family protein